MTTLLKLATFGADPNAATELTAVSLSEQGYAAGATNRVVLLDYSPKPPPLVSLALSRTPFGEGGEIPWTQRDNVAETARVLIIGASQDQVRDRIQEIEGYFAQAHHYQGGGNGDRVYVEWQLGYPSGRLVRCEVLSGQLVLGGMTFDLGWGQYKVEATLGWTRRPLWEDVAFEAIPLTSTLTPAIAGDNTALVQNAAPNNWVELPVPAHPSEATFEVAMTHRGLAGADDSRGVARVWAGARVTPDAYTPLVLSTTLTLGSGDQSGVWPPLTNAQLRNARGYYRCLMIAPTVPTAGAGIRIRPYWYQFGRAWSGRWVTFPTNAVEAPGQVIDLGLVPWPPNPNLSLQQDWSFGIDRYGATTSATFGPVFFQPTDGWANWRYFANNLDFGRTLVDYADTYYERDGPPETGRWQLMYRVGAPFVLPRAGGGRIYFLAESDTGGYDATRRLQVGIRRRCRFATAPGV